MERTQRAQWTRQDSADYYLVERWGAPYFRINARGNVAFAPPGTGGEGADLHAIVAELAARGLRAPLLLRFDDVLRHRVAALHACFVDCMAELNYRGTYRGVLPIKVNQHRHVVERLVASGAATQLGLEAGSKAELLAAVALLAERQDGVLVCNGYKDPAYVEAALHADLLGLIPYIVLERLEELDVVLAAARRCGIRPRLGVRAKLSARGSGRWKDSSGERSKFGLGAAELVACVRALQDAGMADCLQLLHFHLGSQISALTALGEALEEAGQLYVGLRAQGASSLAAVDCGGGLAVDYDGSASASAASMDYCNRQYARTVVGTLKRVCDAHGAPHPQILTESGRALVAQHAVLVFDVLGVRQLDADPQSATGASVGATREAFGEGWGAAGSAARASDGIPATTTCALFNEAAATDGAWHAQDANAIVRQMHEVQRAAAGGDGPQIYAALKALKVRAEAAFRAGTLDLRARAQSEQIYWATCKTLCAGYDAQTLPAALAHLPKQLADTFYCNFSVFRSLPDTWAVQALFPIAPLHRHDEEPTRHATLADLTCDSDGKLDRFVAGATARATLRLHPPNGGAYYLGAFLVGAYQEILGDLHNLFGDTHAVHVQIAPDGTYALADVVAGDTIADVLGQVAYDAGELLARVRRVANARLRAGNAAPEQVQALLQRFDAGLSSYTYLTDFA